MKSLILSASCAVFLLATTAAAQAPVTFGTVRLPQAVMADGHRLAAGSYQVRITNDRPTPGAGQSPTGECWVEFVKGGSVAGREVASVIPADEIGPVAKKETKPAAGASRVDMLKGGEFLRVWMNRAGTHYMVNMPIAR